MSVAKFQGHAIPAVIVCDGFKKMCLTNVVEVYQGLGDTITTIQFCGEDYLCARCRCQRASHGCHKARKVVIEYEERDLPVVTLDTGAEIVVESFEVVHKPNGPYGRDEEHRRGG